MKDSTIVTVAVLTAICICTYLLTTNDVSQSALPADDSVELSTVTTSTVSDPELEASLEDVPELAPEAPAVAEPAIESTPEVAVDGAWETTYTVDDFTGGSTYSATSPITAPLESMGYPLHASLRVTCSLGGGYSTSIDFDLPILPRFTSHNAGVTSTLNEITWDGESEITEFVLKRFDQGVSIVFRDGLGAMIDIAEHHNMNFQLTSHQDVSEFTIPLKGSAAAISSITGKCL